MELPACMYSQRIGKLFQHLVCNALQRKIPVMICNAKTNIAKDPKKYQKLKFFGA
jgi:hypothetical protein